MTAETGENLAPTGEPRPSRMRAFLRVHGRRPTAERLGLHVVEGGRTTVTTMSGGNDSDPAIVSAKEAGWKATDTLAARWSEGGVQVLVDQNPEAARGALSGKTDTITCMDGRTHKEGKVACAGCGLALLKGNSVNLRQLDAGNPEDAMKFLRASHRPVADFIDGLKKAGIRNTESHGGCGAGDLYAGFYKEKWGGDMSGDEAARLWAEKLAKLLGGSYKGHAEVSPAFHNERAAYYSFSDAFNPASAPGIFLPGYVISRGRFKDNPNHAASEMGLAATISLGKGGYGERFTADKPFFFVIVARNTDEAAAGKRELEHYVAQFNGRVRLKVVIIA